MSRKELPLLAELVADTGHPLSYELSSIDDYRASLYLRTSCRKQHQEPLVQLSSGRRTALAGRRQSMRVAGVDQPFSQSERIEQRHFIGIGKPIELDDFIAVVEGVVA